MAIANGYNLLSFTCEFNMATREPPIEPSPICCTFNSEKSARTDGAAAATSSGVTSRAGIVTPREGMLRPGPKPSASVRNKALQHTMPHHCSTPHIM